MADYFLDSSALVKRYAEEEGTDWVMRIADAEAGHRICIARITGPEVVSAFFRKVRNGQLPEPDAIRAVGNFLDDFYGQYVIMEITADLCESAMTLTRRHALRTYDAIQLAAALECRSAMPQLIFVSADHSLNVAAQGEGFTIINPNNDP